MCSRTEVRQAAPTKQLVGIKALGGIAQLGERLHGMQEVIGSIPFTSTKKIEEIEKSVPRI